MRNHVILLVLGVLGCAAPQPSDTVAPVTPDPLTKELAKLREAVSRLQQKIEHLESDISAATAEGELTTMTIDAVEWHDGSGMTPSDFAANHPILCHVVEWKGFGKMLRFTRRADPVFDLVADGHPPLNAMMMEGGCTTSDGSKRAVMLAVTEAPVPNVRYHLRPRNENERYRWSVPDDLVIVAQDPKQ